MNSDGHLFRAIQALLRDGLIFVTDIPSVPEAISRLVDRVGPLQNSFYGLTWDVKSKPNADNVAYTDKDLGFHMDLLYMKTPPDFQFLHCIHNTCTGGESRFVDTHQARRIMEANHPEHIQPLRDHEVIYQYENFGQHYSRKRPVFSGAQTVYWSPPFVRRLSNRLTDLPKFLAASKVFAEILERPDMVYETKMEEGTCAIFQNTRVVHARNGFNVNSGHRWLRGAYLDYQPLLSMYTRLNQQSLEETANFASR